MRRRFGPIPVLLVAIAVAQTGGCDRGSEGGRAEDGQEQDTVAPRLLYTVAVKEGERLISVTLEMRDVTAGALRMAQTRPSRDVRIASVRAENGAGKELTVREDGPDGQPVRVVHVPQGTQAVKLRWTAEFLRDDRHGREGYVGARFALLHGGLFLVPAEALAEEAEHRGRSGDGVRVRVRGPNGWDAVSTMTDTGTGHDPSVDGRFALTHLAHSNIALGQFERDAKAVGPVEHVVYTWKGWSATKRDSLVTRARRIFQAFHKQAPCPDLPRYTHIYLPAGDHDEKVTGDFWSHGQAFSSDAYREEPERVWELTAHRISHTINRYELCGMHMAGPEGHWFVEGWSSWVEATHLLSAGVVDSDQRLVTLGNRYRNVFFGLDRTRRDAPIVEEASETREPQTLYFHYTKGPLLVSQLDHTLRARSGGKKSVNGFVAHIYPRYRGHQKALPLEKELTRYLGRPVKDFFDEYVRKRGAVYPVSPGFLGHLATLEVAEAERAPALRVNGDVMSHHQLEALTRFFRISKVKDADDAKEEAVAMLLLHREYLDRKASFIPEVMVEQVGRLPGSVRTMMFRHQMQALFDDPEAYRAWHAAARKEARVEMLDDPGT